MLESLLIRHCMTVWSDAVHSVQQTGTNLARQGNQLQPATPSALEGTAIVVMGIAETIRYIPEVTNKPQKQHC